MPNNITVLLVDDEADFLDPMAFWLRSKGYTVKTAANGEEAVKIVREDPPSIMFLDINMPVMDGAETMKKIREFNTDLPVIIISAYINDERANQMRSCGVSGVFYKGMDFKDGLLLLETVLRTHKKLK